MGMDITMTNSTKHSNDMMIDNIKVISNQIEACNGPCIYPIDNIEDAIEEIRTFITESNEGSMTITISLMDASKFKNLPEFEGY